MANLKKEVTSKQSTPNFQKKEYSLPPDTQTYVRNDYFLENSVCFVILLLLFFFLILRFALSSYYWRVSEYQIQYFWYKYCLKSVQIRSFSGPFFFRIWTEYGEMRSISPYSVRVRENTDQKKLRIWTHFMRWMSVKHFIHLSTMIKL